MKRILFIINSIICITCILINISELIEVKRNFLEYKKIYKFSNESLEWQYRSMKNFYWWVGGEISFSTAFLIFVFYSFFSKNAAYQTNILVINSVFLFLMTLYVIWLYYCIEY